jgi:hypothetical protein
MRKWRSWLSWLGIGCLAGLGCADPPKRAPIKPTKEEFHIPPPELFHEPVKYPDEMLNKVQPRRPKSDDDATLPPPGPGNGLQPSPGSPGGMVAPR